MVVCVGDVTIRGGFLKLLEDPAIRGTGSIGRTAAFSNWNSFMDNDACLRKKALLQFGVDGGLIISFGSK